MPSHPLSARLVGKLFGVLGLLVGLSAAAVAAPPTLTSPVRLPGDALIGPAAGSQTGPAIARGGSGYLVVWTDDRAALSPPLGFSGGPYFGSGLGSMLDIYAARLDANGVLIDTTPIVIAQNGYNQSFPQVAWNGQNWLVTWVGEREPYYYTDIYAARVSPGGQVFDSTPILVDVAETTNTRVATAVASDGANWTVVWQDIDSQAGIFTLDAARVSPAGVVLDPGGKRLRRPAWNSYPYAPRLAFAGSQYLLVWHEGVDTGNVVAQRFSPTLAPLGSPFSINRQIEISKGEKVRVASNGTDFLVAWHEARYQIGELIAARVSATGVVLDPNGIFIEPDGGVTDFAPDVAWDGARWFVAYHMPATGVDHDLYVKRLSPAGAMLDASRRLVLNGVWDQNRPVIAPTGAGGVQLAAITRPAASPGPDDVATLRVAATGAAGAASIASVGAPRQVAPRMAAGSNGYLVVFGSVTSGGSRLLAQRLATGGAAQDAEPQVIAEAMIPIGTPSVAWNGSVYFIVWSQGGKIVGRRMLPTGEFVDPAPLPVMDGAAADVAASGATFLVVGTIKPTHHSSVVRAVRVSGADGALLGAPLQVSGSFAVAPAVAGFTDRWLVVWEQHGTHDNPRASIPGAFVNADGTLGTRHVFTGIDYHRQPSIASSGSAALVAWHNSDIWARRITRTGTLAPETLSLAKTPELQAHTDVAYNGGHFVVTWVDQRHEPFPKQPKGDIYAARVDASGYLLDAQPWPVATSLLPEESPSVGGRARTAIIAYVGLVPQPPYGALRIHTRHVPMADTNEPYALFKSPAPGAWLKTLTAISGTAADDTGGSGLASLRVRLRRATDGSPISGRYWNGSAWVVAETDLALAGTTSWSVSSPLPSGATLPDGQYQLVALVADNAGNAKTVTSDFGIDTVAPTVAVTYPANGDTAPSIGDIRGDAGDSEGGSGLKTVMVRIRQLNDPNTAADDKWWNGSAWGTTPTNLRTDSSESWVVMDWVPDWQSTNGRYLIYAYAYDAAGNVKSTTSSATVEAP